MNLAAHRRAANGRPRPAEAGGPRINGWLDAFARPRASICGIEAPPYLICGVCGLAAAFTCVCGLALWLSFPVGAVAALLVVAVATFIVLGLVRKAFLKRDCHVLLEDVLFVLLITAGVARAARLPLLTTLDLTAIGTGVFLVFGRIGCLAAGCCHGRPAPVGVCYEPGSVDELLAGIRLFPVQAVESAWFAIITAAAAALLLTAPAGAALWFWLIAGAAGRFVLEFARGDRRPQWGPLTEPQWLSVSIVVARIAIEPGVAPRIAAAAVAAVILAGYLTRRYWLALPEPLIPFDAVKPWQEALTALEEHARSTPGEEVFCEPPSGCTRVRLMADPAGENREVHSYSIEGCAANSRHAATFAIAGLIEQRLPAHWVLRADFCAAGVFHLWFLLEASAPRGSAVNDPPLQVLQRSQAFARMLRDMPPIEPPPRPEPEGAETEEPIPAWYFRGSAATRRSAAG